jgi:hypothetical protein
MGDNLIIKYFVQLIIVIDKLIVTNASNDLTFDSVEPPLGHFYS